ncbi:hypothetical protein C8A05DRAFT_34314 [Staphylotrichum tortipilum]|uniref:Uncharacterized protein n=1 Tax=Staphylotrichum tortipilum TaxID=2831512 RepID=A0AAN6MKN5_9PEZI|nr:hypothetical protein C8A05DRAFT_34314 [Staphylotrichum longicolle]
MAKASAGAFLRAHHQANGSSAVINNGGGSHLKASNKETVGGKITTPVTFTSDQNGGVNGVLTIGPTSQGCPSGQKLVLDRVRHSNVMATDTTNSASTTVSLSPNCKTLSTSLEMA